MTVVYWTLFAVAAFVLLYLVPLLYVREQQAKRERWLRMPGATTSKDNP